MAVATDKENRARRGARGKATTEKPARRGRPVAAAARAGAVKAKSARTASGTAAGTARKGGGRGKSVKGRGKTAASSARRLPALRKKLTKIQLYNEIAANTGVSRKDVVAVFEELEAQIERHVRKRSVGEFTLSGLLKIQSIKQPARPARKNVPNPFRPGEVMNVSRRPACHRVKVKVLKRLKGYVS